MFEFNMAIEYMFGIANVEVDTLSRKLESMNVMQLEGKDQAS